MSVQPPPSNTSGNYNPTDWTNGNQFVDEAYISENFLSYPSAQGQETLADTIISGTLTAQSPATFSDLATFNNGIDISTTAGVKFSDDTVQTTAFIEANYAQLNTDNTFLAPYVQKFASGITFGDDTTQTTAFIEANYAQLNTDNTFLAPYQNTFAGNASTGNANAPIKLTNGVAGEYATLYLNPSVGEDITLYTNQTTNGGLTVRNPTNSYTINPATINGTNNWANFLNPINSSLGINAGYVNINGTSSSTLNVYAPSSTINYTQISQQNGSSTVIANSYWAGSSGGIYFQLKSDSTNYYSPFNITSGLVQCLPPLQCSSAITATQFTTGSTTIAQSPTLNPQIASFTNSYNGTQSPQFYFQMQNTTNTGYFAPLQIINTGITASVPITIPTSGTYPQVNSNIVPSITYVNNAIASIGGNQPVFTNFTIGSIYTDSFVISAYFTTTVAQIATSQDLQSYVNLSSGLLRFRNDNDVGMVSSVLLYFLLSGIPYPSFPTASMPNVIVLDTTTSISYSLTCEMYQNNNKQYFVVNWNTVVYPALATTAGHNFSMTLNSLTSFVG